MTVRTRCGHVMFTECSELLYRKGFPLRLKEAVCKSYVKPDMLYGSEVWCLNESEMGMLHRIERFIVSAMYGVQLKDMKRGKDFMLMFGLDETVGLLAMVNSVHWYGHVRMVMS